jgi:hypothetical protein
VVNKKQCSLKVWTKEGYEFKASITWDYPCCPIHNKQIISLRIYSLVKDDLVLILYLDTYYIALSSIASA